MDVALGDRKVGEGANLGAASILGRANPRDILEQPFRHLVAGDALPVDTYATLAAQFPSMETILGGRPLKPNAAARLTGRRVLGNPAIPPDWRNFFEFHTSQRFWAEIVRVFGSALRATHPDLEQRAGKKLEDWRAGPRGIQDDLDVRLDCQFTINTPWSADDSAGNGAPPSVKTAHVDKRDTIFSALLYFRDAADEGQGGDLEFYSWSREPRFIEHRLIMLEDLQLQKQVRYAPNTLVAFVNSAQAAHGVTPRAPSRLPRRYINFIAETPFNAFKARRLGKFERLVYWHRLRRLGVRETGGYGY